MVVLNYQRVPPYVFGKIAAEDFVHEIFLPPVGVIKRGWKILKQKHILLGGLSINRWTPRRMDEISPQEG